MPIIERDVANRIATHWLEAWNAHDAKAVVEHFADDVAVSSPLIEQRRPGSGGRLGRKADVLDYYEEGLRLAPELRFELVDVLRGIDKVTIVYRDRAGRLIAETLTLDARHIVVAVDVSRGEASQ
jgi:ketosteroid isomerase-like protein